VHLVGFITKKFVTMHGHTNVKKDTHPLRKWTSSISDEEVEDRTCNYEPFSCESLSFLAMFEHSVQLEIMISTYFSICCTEISYTALRAFQNLPLEVSDITTLHCMLTQGAFIERSKRFPRTYRNILCV